MGIDAEILVRTTATVTEDDIKQWSYALASSFGTDKFFITDAEGAWTDKDRHALALVDEWVQDGPTLHPAPRETFIECNVWTRYYGIGYERGDMPFIVNVCDWIELTIPDAEVWYGGDSSGVVAEPFPREERLKLFTYFAHQGHGNYVGVFQTTDPDNPKCDFCGGVPATSGWMNATETLSWTCRGCNSRWERQGGKVVQTKRPGDREIERRRGKAQKPPEE